MPDGKDFKGLGDVGVDIFFREVQVAWDELFPEYPRLVTALVRVELDDGYDAVRNAA